ncbi:MAG: DUF3991 and toprim domain-containing protein [Eubacterium sp.]|nr:DUF3991 and toprim domain-containing protein [Eubacterium sp.]
MQVSKNQIESARKANLADFFRNNGYETEQHGNELHIKGFGGLYVNTAANSWFQFSEQRGDKNPINCLTNVLGMDFTSAVSALSNEAFQKNVSYSPTPKNISPQNVDVKNKNQNAELELPINEHEKKRVFAYLIKERHIDAKLVQDLVDKKLLYQGSVKYRDKEGNEQYAKGNAVFVQKDMDGNVVGAEIHGTNSFKRFKKIAGAGDENLFQYPIGTPKKVYAFESTIDLLSFKMLADPEKIQNSLLVSMGGLKPNALKKFEAKGLKIYSCVDNDEKGKKFNEVNGFKSAGRKLSEEGVKDWNELLQKRVQSLGEKTEAVAEKKAELPTEKAVKRTTHKSPKL